MFFERAHFEVEQALEASGLTHTLLRPNAFMQNMLRRSSDIAHGSFSSSAGDARVAFVDARNVAGVAAEALRSSSFDAATLTLTGPESLSYEEVAATLSRVLGRPIRYRRASPDEERSRLKAQGAPSWAVDEALALERDFLAGRWTEVLTTIADVTGREPRSFEQFAVDHRAAFEDAFTPRNSGSAMKAIVGQQEAGAQTVPAADVVRRWYDLIGSGGGMSAPEVVADDARWQLMDGFPAGGVWHGRAAVFERYTPLLMQSFEDIRAVPDMVRPFADSESEVVAFGHYRGRTRSSGARFEIPFAHVWSVRNGKIAGLRQYTDTLLVAQAVAGAATSGTIDHPNFAPEMDSAHRQVASTAEFAQ